MFVDRASFVTVRHILKMSECGSVRVHGVFSVVYLCDSTNVGVSN